MALLLRVKQQRQCVGRFMVLNFGSTTKGILVRRGDTRRGNRLIIDLSVTRAIIALEAQPGVNGNGRRCAALGQVGEGRVRRGPRRVLEFGRGANGHGGQAQANHSNGIGNQSREQQPFAMVVQGIDAPPEPVEE